MKRRRQVPCAALVVAMASGASACTTTTVTTGYTPITGVIIRSSALISGYGCGKGANQVYRYAAVVSNASDGGRPGGVACLDSGAPGTSWVDVFDCFTDGVFEQIPTTCGGLQSFDVVIYAYNKTAYDSSGLPASLQCSPEAGVCGAQDPRMVAAAASAASWRTTCTATQQQGVPVLAACRPLEPLTTVIDGGASPEASVPVGDASGAGDAADAADAADGAD